MPVTTACNYDVRADRSPIQGIGVFAMAKIPRRAKIGEITGELISVREARKRARGRSRICLIDLCDRHALDCTKGNILRRLNHSCRPNAFLRIIRTRVEVYALRNIKPGEELTLDYGETPHDDGMQCKCGHRECRSRI
jgi:SET domain-containing protein